MKDLDLNRTEKSQDGILFRTMPEKYPGHIIIHMDDSSAWNGFHLDESEVDEILIWLNDWLETQ